MSARVSGDSVQEVGTPRAFLDAVERRFGKLAWDLAADETNHVTPGWFGPGWPCIEEQDSLKTDSWGALDGLLWINPPYANIGEWAKKCCRHWGEGRMSQGTRIALLVPASVGTNWFAEHVNGCALVLFLRPRLTFIGHKDPYPKDLMLAVYGEKPGFECWKWNAP